MFDTDMRNEPQAVIQKLIKERYFDAKSVFWAGSVALKQGTSASDLDLVVILKSLPNAYREALDYDGWPVDVFIHDLDTLRYFCEEIEPSDGCPALINMVLNGHEILASNEFSKAAKAIAKEALENGPNIWSQSKIAKERFFITDILDDIKFPKNKEEKITSAINLFEPLFQFYFLSKNKWAASGKALIRLLRVENIELADEWSKAFETLVQTGDHSRIENVVIKILSPQGGFLWDGFRSNAPIGWKKVEENKVLEELKKREPIFHHPEIFGKTKKDIQNQMCNEFWEVGASGSIYTKQYVIETLLDRYNNPDYKDIWEAKDFALTQISPDNYLLTYTLIQENKRVTRRSTIWKRASDNWKILYHQGTVIDKDRVF